MRRWCSRRRSDECISAAGGGARRCVVCALTQQAAPPPSRRPPPQFYQRLREGDVTEQFLWETRLLPMLGYLSADEATAVRGMRDVCLPSGRRRLAGPAAVCRSTARHLYSSEQQQQQHAVKGTGVVDCLPVQPRPLCSVPPAGAGGAVSGIRRALGAAAQERRAVHHPPGGCLGRPAQSLRHSAVQACGHATRCIPACAALLPAPLAAR